MLAGTSDTKSSARIAVAVAVPNMVLSSMLIFAAGWGRVGSAIASTTAVAAGALALIPRVREATGLVVAVRPESAVWRAWTVLAVPDVVFRVVSYGGDAVIAAVVARSGTVSLAAHRLMGLAVSLMWMFVFGIGVAISVLAGQRLGAGDERGRRAVVRAGAVLMIGASCVVALLLIALSPVWFRLLASDAAVSAAGGGVVWSLPVPAPIMAVGTIYAAQLRAAGDTKAVMYASLFSVVCVTLPAVWVPRWCGTGGCRASTSATWQAGSLAPQPLTSDGGHEHAPIGHDDDPVFGWRRGDSAGQGSGQDFFDDVALGVSVVLNVLPPALSQFPFGPLVIRPVIVVAAQPIAESEHPLDLYGPRLRREDVQVDAAWCTVFYAPDEASMLKPVRFADAQRVSDALERRDVGRLVGGIRDEQQDVDDRFGCQPRNRGGTGVLEAKC
ncbi:hypothetical protein FHY52_05555 [Nocardia nova]|nr:hypothetical protein [Nocardia nova]